jgi:hypothetical protein
MCRWWAATTSAGHRFSADFRASENAGQRYLARFMAVEVRRLRAPPMTPSSVRGLLTVSTSWQTL